MIEVISVAVGLMAIAALYGFAFVRDLPVGAQILFVVGFGLLVSLVIGIIGVALYRFVGSPKERGRRPHGN